MTLTDVAPSPSTGASSPTTGPPLRQV
ncbi:MAG: hypothetical protein QOJ69_444, partial [Actinomycetota bacterium]|nr:hypothetical protein [Actinomycetota bacterium]